MMHLLTFGIEFKGITELEFYWLQKYVFGTGFGGISCLNIGPDDTYMWFQ